MAQNTNVLLADDEAFTRTDYTALRAYCMRLPIERIAQLYYSEDSPQVERGLERFLIRMRDILVERASESQPAFADALTNARKTGNISPRALNILVQAVDQKKPVPVRGDPISRWFRPRTVQALRSGGIETLGAFVDLVNARGEGWWRSIPRVGAKRAATLLAWLRSQKQLGDVAPAPRRIVAPLEYELLDPERCTALRPLGSFCLPVHLDGQFGVNRASAFSFITARDDLAAIDCYLARYEYQPHTLRAYRRELERLLLWCVHIAQKPLSSLLVDDCESYKRFMTDPSPAFRGLAAQRGTALWRPFSVKSLSVASQRYAVMVLRAAFDWLVRVRYLAGNPWQAVRDPQVIQRVTPINVGRALPLELWEAVVETLRRRGEVHTNRQDRIALAVLLLMGDCGLRRAEAVRLVRGDLHASMHAHGLWMLTALGKRNKERLVPVTPRTMVALRKHWADHDLDVYVDAPMGRPLLVPLAIPRTRTARTRHDPDKPQIAGYTADAVYALVKAALARVQQDLAALDNDVAAALTSEQIERLTEASPHAFRHTFGTVSTEQGMSEPVVQDVMGHADSSTTKLYSRSREKHIAQEALRLYAQRDALRTEGLDTVIPAAARQTSTS